MLAVQANLLTLLDGRKQFIIPIYQRTYRWELKQCRQLWEDILRTAQDARIPAHFIGSVVYIKAGPYDAPVTTTPQMLLIDGQQRLTTLSLLLIALREALKATSGEEAMTPEEIDDYLINKHGKGELRHKLVLTQGDKDTLAALIDGRPLPSSSSLRIEENYRFFLSQIQASPLSLDVLFHGVQKLMLVDISLDRSHDNPQLIFESLNSTGLDLSQADLIRNFILMGQEPAKQTDLYNDFWYPMERSFAHGEASLFDRFMRDYLTIKMDRIPNMNEVYAEFKGYARDHPDLTIREIVSDVHQYSQYFVNLAFARESDKALKTGIQDINTLKVDVAYPFLMRVYHDYRQGDLSHDNFLRVLRLVESYVFRRAICDIPTNSLNKTFAALYKQVTPTSFIESLEAMLLLKDSYRRFPNDDEFRAQLLVKDVYNFRTRNYLLGKLENMGRRETVTVEEYTIEHIMPQTENLSSEWRRDLGTNWKHVHDTYLHTLGNLTLTAYNSEYSARPFVEKRDLVSKDGHPCGFAHSPLHLNQGLGTLAHWDEAAIKARAIRLADVAIQCWSQPKLSAGTVAIYASPTVPSPATPAQHDEAFFCGRQDLYEELRRRVLNLDASVEETVYRNYIQFHTENRFLAVRPQKSRLRVTLNMKLSDMADPKGLCKDVSGMGYYGGGDTLLALTNSVDLNDVMAVVRQAYVHSLNSVTSDIEGGTADGTDEADEDSDLS